ncbi:nucleoside 2-deoxyribosyltransferase [Desulforhopalus sp. 52FAK]
MKYIYFAGPLFTMAEKQFNLDFSSHLKARLANIEIILPQERAPAIISQDNGPYLVFRDCLEMIDKCDLVVAILDGADADSGTSVEIGYAYAAKKPVIGVRTDFRISEENGLNLMLANICTELVLDVNSDIHALADKVSESTGIILKS